MPGGAHGSFVPGDYSSTSAAKYAGFETKSVGDCGAAALYEKLTTSSYPLGTWERTLLYQIKGVSMEAAMDLHDGEMHEATRRMSAIFQRQ